MYLNSGIAFLGLMSSAIRTNDERKVESDVVGKENSAVNTQEDRGDVVYGNDPMAGAEGTYLKTLSERTTAAQISSEVPDQCQTSEAID